MGGGFRMAGKSVLGSRGEGGVGQPARHLQADHVQIKHEDTQKLAKHARSGAVVSVLGS